MLLVYDIADHESFDRVSKWLDNAREHCDPSSTAMLLLGNKLDLDERRAVEKEEAETFAAEQGLVFMEVSAKTGEGVQEAFLLLVQAMYASVRAAESEEDDEGVLGSTNIGSATASSSWTDCCA